MLKAAYTKQTFQFTFQARTSRGAMRNRTSWFVKLWYDANPEIFGVGECAPLPGLSIDDVPEYEKVLKGTLKKLSIINCQLLTVNEFPDLSSIVSAEFPSIIFGIETALLDLQNGGRRVVFNNDFVTGKKSRSMALSGWVTWTRCCNRLP